ncbi:MAG: hypothetical protein ACYTFF_16965, partial [Planctomycetota bacterium]
AVIDEDIWPLPSVTKKVDADPSQRYGFSDYLMEGRHVYEDVIKYYYDQTNQEFGTNIPLPK